MKKNLVLVIVIVVVVLAAGGGYLWLHNSSTSPTPASSKSAVSNSVVVSRTNASVGSYLAEPNGRALYTYGKDASGLSNCTGSCLVTWPAYQDKGSTTNLPTGISTIKRSDNGEIQYTYNGMPLYTFVGDVGTRMTGNGISDFSVAKLATSTTSTSTTSNSSSSDSW